MPKSTTMQEIKFKITPSVKRAQRFYRDEIKPKLGDDANGQWIVIDANSGEFEVDEDVIDALRLLEKRVPDLDRVFVRDGEFLPGHFGGFARAIALNMSQEALDSMPPQGSLNYKHYLYGFPKRDRYPWQE